MKRLNKTECPFFLSFFFWGGGGGGGGGGGWEWGGSKGNLLDFYLFGACFRRYVFLFRGSYVSKGVNL